MAKTTLVAIEMGYGHLRPAHALGELLDTPVLECDRAPLAGADEQAQWSRARRVYEFGSRLSQLPVVGSPLRSALDSLTFIEPLHPFRDLSAPTAGTRALEHQRKKGMGGGLVEHLGRTGAPLLATFFAPAVIADRAGCEQVYCVVTDSDINRVWAPIEAGRSRIRYFAPSLRVERRLRAYGVPAEHIEYTGYPLPDELLGGMELEALKRNLRARLVRLDPEQRFRQAYRDELHHFLGELPPDEERKPPLLTFAVGGAGAQARLARDFLPGLRGLLEAGRFRLALVAGVRDEVAAEFRAAIAGAKMESLVGGPIEILIEADMNTYFRRFNRLIAGTDILWTKPSEITFFAALGLPLVFSWPMGVHERYNRRWAMHAGAGLKQSDPRFAADWIGEWLSDGTLAAAAWSGYMRLPKFGLYRIVEKLQAAQNK